jgi:hypothetical protein
MMLRMSLLPDVELVELVELFAPYAERLRDFLGMPAKKHRLHALY